jgi:hypothetical protein
VKERINCVGFQGTKIPLKSSHTIRFYLKKKKMFYLVLYRLRFHGKVFGKLRSPREWVSLCGRRL